MLNTVGIVPGANEFACEIRSVERMREEEALR
jgi:hypothetical protein